MNLADSGVDSSTQRQVEDRVKIASPQAALVGAALPIVLMALRHHFRDRHEMLVAMKLVGPGGHCAAGLGGER